MKLAPFILLMTFFLRNNSGADERHKREDDSSESYSKCYDDIGCIETDSRWYDKNLRPVNLKPLDRHIIKTDFLLIKPNKSEAGSLLYNSMMANHNSIKSAGFTRHANVTILIHDFTGNGYTGWIKHLSVELLKKSSSINIISTDWQRGAEPPYDQAISNARVVALEILALLKELKEKFSLKLGHVHIVGHGVGAHIAGYVGSTYNSIRKITGLDPSGPRFEGMPNIVKLNPACAKYVEVLHTDAFDSRSQGTKEAMGHSDFYLNNAYLQPGCPENTTYDDVTSVARSNLNEGEILPGCSHKRAFKYFIEAVSSSRCVFLGIKCDSYDDFAKGRCISCNKSDSACRTFGINTYKSSVEKTSFYLSSADHTPYCSGKGDHQGYFDFILVDDKANAAEASVADAVSNYRNIAGEAANTFVYYAQPPKIGKIKEAKVRWNEKKKFYCVIYCKQIINVEKITVKFIGTGNNDEGHERSLCPVNSDTEIENGAYKTYVSCKSQHHHSTSTASSDTDK
ncbi:hypothetical protein NQ317_014136 [Molorchus minor]|uniref:Lipase domain-containing protein n=1 Tax=Molorchus minor TaxID=1323400 RepID=A0ABQ9JGQ2_9CUCU|nr:hypothetical protein NQ317_014136 [Molorchus minor]